MYLTSFSLCGAGVGKQGLSWSLIEFESGTGTGDDRQAVGPVGPTGASEVRIYDIRL